MLSRRIIEHILPCERLTAMIVLPPAIPIPSSPKILLRGAFGFYLLLRSLLFTENSRKYNGVSKFYPPRSH